MKKIYFTLLALIVLVISCKTSSSTKNLKKDSELESLYAAMQGSFNSEKQSLADSTYYNISLHMYPIWKDRGNWLYVEQALNSMQNKPYRQRIYEVKRNEKGQLASYVYAIPNDSLWIGKWKTPSAFDALKTNELIEREGCEVILQKQNKNMYSGKTETGTCESSLRGASYATSQVKISSKTIESWNQGFDKDGKQVWGATKGAYVFDKLD